MSRFGSLEASNLFAKLSFIFHLSLWILNLTQTPTASVQHIVRFGFNLENVQKEMDHRALVIVSFITPVAHMTRIKTH